MWLVEPLLYGDDDDDLLAPPEALVPEEVAFLEFNATVHLVRLEDTMPSLDWPAPGGGGLDDGKDGGDASGGDGFGDGGTPRGEPRGPHAERLPNPLGGVASQRRWGGGRERWVALGHTTSVLPWSSLRGDGEADVAVKKGAVLGVGSLPDEVGDVEVVPSPAQSGQKLQI
jgi:hypothetical protein